MIKLFKPIHSIFSRTAANSCNACRKIGSTQSNRQHETEPTTAPPTVLVEKDSNITLIGINREQARNSIDTATAQKLSDAFHQFEADDQSPVAVLYGVGGTFCAGYDLMELEQQSDKGSLDFLLRHEGSVGPTRRHLQKPVVCGINGFCVASGLELALLCDMRVMEDTAIMAFFNRRLGVPMSDGGTVRLAASVGYSRALDIIASGRRVGAAEALKIGLVNRVVATGTALGQAVHLAFSIAKYPRASLQHDRNSLYRNKYERKSFGARVQNELLFTDQEVVQEMEEGLRSFKKGEGKDAKGDLWFIKQKTIPDWERKEIMHEERTVKEKE